MNTQGTKSIWALCEGAQVSYKYSGRMMILTRRGILGRGYFYRVLGSGTISGQGHQFLVRCADGDIHHNFFFVSY